MSRTPTSSLFQNSFGVLCKQTLKGYLKVKLVCTLEKRPDMHLKIRGIIISPQKNTRRDIEDLQKYSGKILTE